MKVGIGPQPPIPSEAFVLQNFDKENFNDDRLPQKGILQFYISSNDDIYGMNFDEQDKQTDWKVVYHENVNYNISEKEIINNGIKTFKEATPEYYAPFNEIYKITFKATDEVMSCYDEKFNSIVTRILKDKFNVIVEENKVSDYLEQIDEKYYEKFETWGHKLLGYPAFTQSDPRYYNKEYSKYDTLLLQIDTDDDIMWGDSGVANFFINKDDLYKRNFNNILYNWDCCQLLILNKVLWKNKIKWLEITEKLIKNKDNKTFCKIVGIKKWDLKKH